MKKNLCWIRRDLRLVDHYALSESLKTGDNFYLIFIFDPSIISHLPPNDRRITFIYESLVEIEKELKLFGSSLIIRYGNPEIILPSICQELKITHFFFNHDFGPKEKARDQKVVTELKKLNVECKHFKDHVIYEQNELKNNQGQIYKVFTPFKNKWLQKFQENDSKTPKYHCPIEKLTAFHNDKSILNYDWFKDLHFTPTKNVILGGRTQALKMLERFKNLIDDYNETRDFPFIEKTSLLSPYIRMGNISIREMIEITQPKTSGQLMSEGQKVWLSELIWREFYQIILDTNPDIVNSNFKKEYNKVTWKNDPIKFEAWCNGLTGFPIVDAAMRCLNQTGLMHNRLRMIVATFYSKLLLMDWREGEKYFALKLLDYDLAANNGGWQWCASTGVDAVPYFRIFNPYNQSIKFDSEGEFIRLWCPELAHLNAKEIHQPPILKNYPRPIINYNQARIEALSFYEMVKK